MITKQTDRVTGMVDHMRMCRWIIEEINVQYTWYFLHWKAIAELLVSKKQVLELASAKDMKKTDVTFDGWLQNTNQGGQKWQ